MSLIYLNGKLVKPERALVSVRDHGFLYGDGVYETMRVYNGGVFLLREHMRRLRHSLQGLSLKPALTLAQFENAVNRTVRANKSVEAVVRLTVTRGPGPFGFDIRPCRRPTVAIEVYPFAPYPRKYHKDGITAAVVSVRRNSPRSLPPHVKSTSCVNGILGKMESIRMKAQEGIFLTLDGAVAEGTVSNVFVVRRGVLMTPRLDGHLLAGVTRGWVAGLARRLKIKFTETRLDENDLMAADEIFLSNTTMEVMPVSRLLFSSGRRAKKLAVGPLTQRLMAAFRQGER